MLGLRTLLGDQQFLNCYQLCDHFLDLLSTWVLLENDVLCLLVDQVYSLKHRLRTYLLGTHVFNFLSLQQRMFIRGCLFFFQRVILDRQHFQRLLKFFYRMAKRLTGFGSLSFFSVLRKSFYTCHLPALLCCFRTWQKSICIERHLLCRAVLWAIN